MKLASSIFATDEELGKRDDDRKPHKSQPRNFWTIPLRYRKRRVLASLIVLFILWAFLHNLPTDRIPARYPYVEPETETGTARHERSFHRHGDDYESITYPSPSRSKGSKAPKGPPPRDHDRDEDEVNPRWYNGDIRFYKLRESLQRVGRSWRYSFSAQGHVVFAASNLKSASVLIPMACEMKMWDRVSVHVAFMGRDDISLQDILELNGVDPKECDIHWHDARPDYPVYSSDFRMESSAAAALGHINTFVSPRVVITDNSAAEDVCFTKGIRAKAKELKLPVIELPKGNSQGFMYITRLDAGSLSSWHKPTVDLLVQAPSESSGSLIRLLKSLQNADYRGHTPPRLIIELPSDIDPPTRDYLNGLVWPPGQEDNPLKSNQLILRHRISGERVSSEDASVRFMESFYPTNADSHVLLLSPRAELSPLYYHYLVYSILEFKYSSYGADDSTSVMGVSLELPSKYLNGSTDFHPPGMKSMNHKSYTQRSGDKSVPFLWQAPNSNAALYFGDKWIEIHSFLRFRFQSQKVHKLKPRSKVISKNFPSWLEYVLEYMRARGYAMVYPATLASDALVTIHNELYQPPEEFGPLTSSREKDKAIGPLPKSADEAPLSADILPAPQNREPPLVSDSRPLHRTLPLNGDFPEVKFMAILSYSGSLIDPGDVGEKAERYAANFRREIGVCPESQKGMRRRVQPGSARDLFCFGNEDEKDWEKDTDIPGVSDDEGEELDYMHDMEDSDWQPKHRVGASSASPSSATSTPFKSSASVAAKSPASESAKPDAFTTDSW